MKDVLANVHALKMRKSCAVGMRNAILRNHLKSLPMLDTCNHMFSKCDLANTLLKMYVRVNLD